MMLMALYKINITAKGGHKDYVLIAESLIMDEINYLKQNSSAKYLFVSHTSFLPLDRRVVYEMIKRKLAKVGISNTSIHKMRHTYANHLKHIGENIETIQKLCRHKNITTTAKFYLDTAEEDKMYIATKLISK